MTYKWKASPIKFSPGPRMGYQGVYFEFDSKEHFDLWYKSSIAWHAELDEVMNFCKYFVRVKGNNGHYVREGKSFPVDGSWIGNQDFDDFPACQPFVQWLKINGWRNSWFELMDKYEQAKECSVKPRLLKE